MNCQHLTVKELIQYLDLTSTDPLVRRLLQLLQEESLMEELAAAGMDPVTREFKQDWEYFGPASYIEKLRNDVDYYVEECNNLENKVRELEGEVTRMSTVSLVNFIADVHHKLEMSKLEQGRAERRAEAEREARKEAEQKFEFWEKMNHGIR